MQSPTPPPSTLLSPSGKRKRPLTDPTSSDPTSPSPTRLKTTDLPARTLAEDVSLFPPAALASSPRTTVAGHLSNLELGDFNHQAPMLEGGGIGDASNVPVWIPAPNLSCPTTSPAAVGGASNAYDHDPTANVASLPLPPTPPKSSHGPHEEQPVPMSQPEPTTSTGSSSSSIPKSSSVPPSPPLTLWWTTPEITGHTASDPLDDGYGINGIGFIPTPAMASARAERRRRQVREWKEREARDARVRRGERRRRLREGTFVPGEGRTGSAGDNGRRVRFLEV